jgi:hypothetical protein
MNALLLLGLTFLQGHPVNPDYVFATSDLSKGEVLSRAAAAGDAIPADDGDDLTLLGLSQVDGEAAYKLKLVHQDGSVEYRWLSKKSFHELKRTAIAANPIPAPSSTPASSSAAR